MFELQDSKGNRFRLSRGGQSQEHAALALEGNPLQVKRLLKFCDSIALVRAYSFFYRSHSKSKKADGNATHAKRHRNTLLITRGNSQSITASNIPKAQRPSTRIPTPEERLFKAIASGELHLAQTHKVEAFNVTRAEKELGLTRSKLLSDCNALILEKKRLANRGQASLWGLVASSTAHNELKGHGARARIITLNYQRFCACLPNVKKIDGARDLQSTTGNQGSAEIQARDMLKALGFSTTKVTTSQFQRAQQQLEQIWKSKNLYKQAREFSSDYAKAQKSTEKAAEKDLATYELTLSLLICHDQPIHALASPAPEQINLFSRYKTLGRGFWKAAETARAIEAERETIAGRATAAKFDDLAAADNEERERNTPPATLTFIEITLLDDKGEPIANEPYWVLDPEGNEHTGNLDGSGFARIDNIKPGNCQVAFPEIEGSGISQCRADVDCCTPAVVEPEPAWAEFTLEDDDGNPIADEEYILTCPEGKEHSGKTDAEGKARVEGIKEGVCSVKFPNRDSDAVSSTPPKANERKSTSKSPAKPPANNKNTNPSIQNNTTSTTQNASGTQATPSATASPPSKSKTPTASKNCNLVSATAKCSHGGRTSSGGILEVVPSESGDLISLDAAINDNCGDHAQWDIRGPMGYSQKTGASTSFKANNWMLGNADTLFISHADPQTYAIDVKGCSGSKRLTVLSYPNDKLSVKFNGLGKEKSFAEKLDYVVNSLSQFLPKFQFNKPSGSVTFSAQWAEHKDHRAFYRYQISGGFNPVIGATLRIPFGPTAAIPSWVKQYGDFYFFVEFTGGVSLNLNFEKFTPDTHTAYVEAKGGIEGKIGASLFLMDDSVLKAEAFGSTGISFKGWTDKELDNPKLFGQFEWEGLKGTLSVQVGWGWVEFNREWTVVDGGPLHKEPMVTNLKDWID